MTALTLYELNSLVQGVVEQTMADEYWVQAEIASASEHRGHLYLELVQNDERTHTPIARAQAKCWASSWMMIRRHFERVTQRRLTAGMSLLLKVYAQFHPAYGFSWIVTDIDPTFTLGDMARRRNEIVRQLKEDGVFDMQKQLEMPRFCQRIAVISSQTAAGYGDFCRHLQDNAYGLTFDVRLFPAIMQGEQVEQSVINALNAVNEHLDEYDCVVIIRGGGATADMSGFDTLSLAENVAQFPLPIITGIGHERDECVLDMVSHTRVKTPTAAAALLIDKLAAVAQDLDNMSLAITTATRQRIERETARMTTHEMRIQTLALLTVERQSNKLNTLKQNLAVYAERALSDRKQTVAILQQQLPVYCQRYIDLRQQKLELLSKRAEMLNPQRILSLGYSMTVHDGHIVKDPETLKEGDVIETRLRDGMLKSVVVKQPKGAEC